MNDPLKSLPGRLEWVGKCVFGQSWASRLAEGLGISRSMLWEYRKGRRTDRDIDGGLLALIDSERDACAERGAMLTRLRRQLIALLSGSKEKSDDAA